MSVLWIPALLSAALGSAAPSPAAGRPLARVHHVETPPVIDGRLDEAVWAEADSIGPLLQEEPEEGVRASEETDVRLLCDAQNLYIGVRCYDREPGKITGTKLNRDPDLGTDDRLRILIDTFQDRRNAYEFELNPLGARGDALLTNNGQDLNTDWDGIWSAKTSIDAAGWVAEVAIPLKTLKFKPGLEQWGFNVARTIRRREESMRWASPRHDVDFVQSSEAGDIHGLTGLRQGFGLSATPFTVARWDYDRSGATSTSLRGQPGFDALYRLTPSVSANFTVNTDFSEAQVDKAQIDLSRFKLFLPEKRDFFLEDAGLFSFADLGTDLLPFWSRRIGLSEAGERVPILGGGKITGRENGWNLGVLDVQTDHFAGAPERNLFAGRLTRNLGTQSTVGGVFTHGDPDGTGMSSTFGFDANYGTSGYLGSKNLNAHAWGLGTQSAGKRFARGNLAYGASIGYPNDRWLWDARYEEIQAGFDPKLGFVPRAGIRRYAGVFNFEPRLHSQIKKLKFGLQPEVVTGLGNRVETANAVVKVLGIENRVGDGLAFEVDPDYERLTEPFDITDHLSIPDARYSFTRYAAVVSTGKRRPVSAKAEVTVGEFFTGHRNDIASSVEWRPSGHFNLAASYEASRLLLPQGNFFTSVSTLAADVFVSPELWWSNFLQYDQEAREYGVNSRVRWIQGPGRQVFLVFSETLGRQENRILSQLAGFAAKLEYTIQL